MESSEGKISEIDTESVIKVSFPHGDLVPEMAQNLVCGLYKEKDSQKRVVKVKVDDQILVGKESAEANKIVNNFLVLRNTLTQKVRLIPIQNYILSEMAAKETQPDVTSQVTQNDSVDLRFKFGTKKQRHVIEHTRRMQTDVDLIENKLLNMSSNILDTSMTQEEDMPRMYMPPINRDADELEDVYNLYDILMPQDMEILKKEALNLMTDPEKFGSDFGTPFFTACLKNVPTVMKEKLLEAVSILIYANLLLKFSNVPIKVISTKSYRACPFSEEIHNKILDNFTIKSSSGRTRPLTMEDKILCYVIVLGLIANKFKMDLQPLAESAKVSLKRLKSLIPLLGAVSYGASSLMLKLPLPPRAKDVSFRRKRQNL